MNAKTEWRMNAGQTEFTVTTDGQGRISLSRSQGGTSYSHGAHDAMALSEGEFAALLMLMNRVMRGLP